MAALLPDQIPFILSLSKDAREASPARVLRQAQHERVWVHGAVKDSHTVHPGNFASHAGVCCAIHAAQLPLARSRTRPR